MSKAPMSAARRRWSSTKQSVILQEQYTAVSQPYSQSVSQPASTQQKQGQKCYTDFLTRVGFVGPWDMGSSVQHDHGSERAG